MVYITGDIHGSLLQICDLFEKYDPKQNDIIVLLGDVGVNYFGDIRDTRKKHILNKYGTTFFCIHGNHENRPQNIESYKEKEWRGGRVLYEEAFPNILFPVDGDIFDLEGNKCIVIGGAYSVDKYYRLKNGWNWWEDEQPTNAVKAYVDKQIAENKVDVIFSHTCPYKYRPVECFLPMVNQSTVDDSTERWLDTIENSVDYTAWYCGHWHTNKDIDKIHFLYDRCKILPTK